MNAPDFDAPSVDTDGTRILYDGRASSKKDEEGLKSILKNTPDTLGYVIKSFIENSVISVLKAILAQVEESRNNQAEFIVTQSAFNESLQQFVTPWIYAFKNKIDEILLQISRLSQMDFMLQRIEAIESNQGKAGETAEESLNKISDLTVSVEHLSMSLERSLAGQRDLREKIDKIFLTAVALRDKERISDEEEIIKLREDLRRTKMAYNNLAFEAEKKLKSLGVKDILLERMKID